MASTNLYAPRINTYANAFDVTGGNGYCTIFFNMSVISGNIADIVKGLHIAITKQDTGISVINKSFTATGISAKSGIAIINTENIQKNDEENLYYFNIPSTLIEGGWKDGVIYKIQIRISDLAYPTTDLPSDDNAWLMMNGSHFSEWSTYCTTKAIKKPKLEISPFDLLKGDYTNTNLIVNGKFNGGTVGGVIQPISDSIYSYQIILKEKTSGVVIEASKELYSESDKIYYVFKVELENGKEYTVDVNYTTINKYEGNESYDFKVNIAGGRVSNIYLGCAETSVNTTLPSLKAVFNGTSAMIESEEGRIGLKIYAQTDGVEDNTTKSDISLYIRRTDSRTNFKKWEEIKIIPLNNQDPNTIPLFYDYTIQSDVWYKYSIQEVNTNANVAGNPNSIPNAFVKPIIREFDSAFLLGEDNRQLKLSLSNGVSSYSYTVSESKLDTIGGKYPIVTRNGNMKYRSFPVTGIISFNMDDRDTFSTDEELYQFAEIAQLYKDMKKGQYDYVKEYTFREKVLEFLQDGKPKLFKSATEGNILVRLINVSTSPNQSLSRMIGTFNSTAIEVAEANLDNYIKYGLHKVKEW